MLRILKAALFAKSPEGWWGLPILLWGDPGTGKTSCVKLLAFLASMAYYRISPGERGEGQFGVVPVPKDGYLTYPPADWAKFLDEAPRGILFIDEINTAVRVVQSALLGAVQLRTIGSHQFHKGIRVLGAANETADAAGGLDMSNASNNRFGHLQFDGLGASDYIDGLVSGFGRVGAQEFDKFDGEAEEARVEREWADAYAGAAGMVAAFLERRPALIHQKPKKGTNQVRWASRRSVHYATHALASSRVHSLSEAESDMFVESFVGKEWFDEFVTWRANMDLPSAADLLDGKVKFEHDPRRLDRTMAVLASCAALVTPDDAEKQKERATATWQLMEKVVNDGVSFDVTVPAARALVRAKLHAPRIPASKSVLPKVQPVLAAAGIRP